MPSNGMYPINEEDDTSTLYEESDNSFTTKSYIVSDSKTGTRNVYSSTYTRRLIRKCGACNVLKINTFDKREKLFIHLQDMVTSLVEIRWRWIFILYAILNVLSWYAFGLVWWLIAYNHGDLRSTVDDLNGYNESEPCVVGVYDLGSSLLFSMETQTTTGYGVRAPSTACPETMFLLTVQTMFGAIFTCIVLGLIFMKAARPTNRSKTIIFSRNAVICMRDGVLCLLFRVADVRKSKILATNIRAFFLSEYTTAEGEFIPKYQWKLDVSVDQSGSEIFLSWPLTVCHKITNDSPLYDLSALTMLQSRFEIIVLLSGVLEASSQTLEARTSYLPSEIFWGHRFQPLVTKCADWKNGYVMDYKLIDEIKPVVTPLCSARQIVDYSNPNSPTVFNFSLD